MTAADLRALARRVCEEQPSRELHKDIARALGMAPSPTVTSGYGWREDDSGWWCETGEDMRAPRETIYPPRWLHSLDAAASLIPAGWGGSMDWGNAGVKGYMALAVRDTGERQSFTVFAPTEPQARVAAALLARAADMEASDAR